MSINRTYRWRGAVELASGTHTVGSTYRWRGAVEPSTCVPADDTWGTSWGCFWGNSWNRIPAAATTPDGAPGGKKKRTRKTYPRRVYIDGKLYTVRTPEEERELLRQWRDTLQARQEALVSQEAPPAVVRKAKIKVVKAQRRIDRVDTREEEWLARLQAEDDEILMAVLH